MKPSCAKRHSNAHLVKMFFFLFVKDYQKYFKCSSHLWVGRRYRHQKSTWVELIHYKVGINISNTWKAQRQLIPLQLRVNHIQLKTKTKVTISLSHRLLHTCHGCKELETDSVHVNIYLQLNINPFSLPINKIN